MNPFLLRWMAHVRREGRTLYAGGWEAFETTRREGLSIEGRAGALLFLLLHAAAFLQTGPLPPYPFDPGPAFLRLSAEARFPAAVFHFFLILLSAGVGAVLGVFLRNAWELAEALIPIPGRRRISRWARWGLTIALLLLMHGGFLAGAFRARPAVFQAAFHDGGGLWRFLQAGLTDGWLVPLGFLLRGATFLLLFLGALRMLVRFYRWGLSFPLPTRIATGVLGAGTVIFLMGVWGVFRFHAPRNKGPNLVVISAAGLRYEDVADPVSSPAINTLLHRGRTFTSGIPSLAVREASFMTLLTGLSPLSHGVRHAFSTDLTAALGPESLPRRLKRAGFSTAVVADAGGDLFSRVSPVFDHVRADPLDVPGLLKRDALRRSIHLLPYLRGAWARRWVPFLRSVPEMAAPGILSAEGRGMLKQLRFEEKFCLFLDYSAMDGRLPVASPQARKALAGDRRGFWPWRMDNENIFRMPGKAGESPEAVQARRLARANVRALDRAVGEVVSSIEKLGLEGSTWIVLWSPYSGGRGEGERSGRGAALGGGRVHEGFLLLSGPSGRAASRMISVPMGAEDVAPTLLAIAGVPPSEEMEGVSLLGEEAMVSRVIYSETDAWYDPAEAPPESRLSYGAAASWLEEDPESPGRLRISPAREDAVLAYKHRMVQWGAERLLYRPGRDGVRYELFDLTRDAAVRRDLSSTREGEERVKELREIFFQFLQRESGWRPRNDFWIPDAFLQEDR